jgi:hypothetical protein
LQLPVLSEFSAALPIKRRVRNSSGASQTRSSMRATVGTDGRRGRDQRILQALMIPVGERHFRRPVAEFVAHYHRERNHQGLDNRLIAGTPAADVSGRLRRRSQVGRTAQLRRAGCVTSGSAEMRNITGPRRCAQPVHHWATSASAAAPATAAFARLRLRYVKRDDSGLTPCSTAASLNLRCARH